MSLSRRGLARVGAGLATTLVVLSGATSEAAPTDDRTTFRALVDTLMPADLRSPGAAALGVDGAIWQQLQQNHGLRNLTAAAVEWLNSSAEATGGHSFVTLGEAERESIVSELASMPADSPAAFFFAVVLGEVYRHYYARAEAWPALGYAGPPQPGGFVDHAEPPA